MSSTASLLCGMTWGRMRFCGEELMGRSVVTKTFIGGKYVQQGIILGTLIDASLVVLEELVFYFSCPFPWFMLLAIETVLCLHGQGLGQQHLLLQLYLNTKERKSLPSPVPTPLISRC